MKHSYSKTFINLWNSIFQKHPWSEAFLLSIACHFALLCFLWLCCEVHVILFPQKMQERIINIEFDKGER
jgi:hypothetical protein